MLQRPAYFASCALLLTALLTSGTGCVGGGKFAALTGKFEGFVVRKSGTEESRGLVSAEAMALSGGRFEVKATGTAESWDLTLAPASKRGEWLFTAAGIFQGAQPLHPVQKTCLASDSRNKPVIHLCFDGRELNLEVKSGEKAFALVLDVADTTIPAPETPSVYEVGELTRRAMSQNYANRIEFEHVVQARRAAENAHANLLPHFTLNTLLGFTSFNLQTLIRSVGDLLPFLLPSRWFRAAESTFRYQAEFEAWVLMKADSANVTEGLALTILRDERALARMEANVAPITRIRDEILLRERVGLLAPGSSDDVTSILNAIAKSRLALKGTLTEEYALLAQAAGFFSPTAIASVQARPDMSIERPEAVDFEAMPGIAVDRSIELRQLDSLMRLARDSKKERYFSWLDSSGGSGDMSGALGFGFFSYVEVVDSQLEELKLKKRQLQQILLQKVLVTSNELRDSLEAYRLAGEGVAIQRRRLDRLTESMRAGVSVALSDLTGCLQDSLRNDLDRVNAEFSYYVAVSKMNRVLLAGPYLEIDGLERSAPSWVSGNPK